MVLRITSIITLLLAVVWLVQFFRKNTDSWGETKSWFSREWKTAFSKECLKNWKRTVFFWLLLMTSVSALTGFVPFLILGAPLGGFALMLHMVLAPLFAIFAALFLLGRAEQHTFDKQNESYLKSLFSDKNEATLADAFWAKFFFWLFALLAVIVASMVLSMYPILGTISQEKLLNIHRGASVALFIVVILFTLRLIRLSSDVKK